jgi:hypothetical protein
VLDDASLDVVESPVVYTIDDGPIEESPDPLPDCMRLQPPPSDAALGDAFTANLGAFQACYADALARNLERQVHTQRRVPPLDGLFELRVVLSGLGKPRVVDVQGPGGGKLYRCMTKAASEVWLPERPSRAPIEAVVRFTLTPTTIVTPIDIAKHERALASASGALQHCKARADLLYALIVQRPWLDDARLIAETRALTREALALPEPKLCLEPADGLLKAIAGDLNLSRSESSWSLLDRIEAVLPIADHVEWGLELRWYHASTIAMLPQRNAEGIGILRALAQSDSLAGALAEGELSRYEPPHPITPAACD